MSKKIFEDGMTIEQKKADVEAFAAQHNSLCHIPGPIGLCAFAAAFSCAKDMVNQGEITMAAYFLTLCDDPNGLDDDPAIEPEW